MNAKRIAHITKFKVRLALDALKDIKTVKYIAQKESLLPIMHGSESLPPGNRLEFLTKFFRVRARDISKSALLWTCQSYLSLLRAERQSAHSSEEEVDSLTISSHRLAQGTFVTKIVTPDKKKLEKIVRATLL